MEYNVKVREERAADYPKVYDINVAAFGGSREAQLVDKLRGSDNFMKELSLVAVIDDTVVGYILFTPISIVQNDNTHIRSLALAPMSVHPDYQKKGIGAKLVKKGLAKSMNLGYKSVVVLGHETYYPKFGFVPAKKWHLNPPFNVPEKYFMALELTTDALENASGVVKYSEEFRL